jgi:hypothetical protein
MYDILLICNENKLTYYIFLINLFPYLNFLDVVP